MHAMDVLPYLPDPTPADADEWVAAALAEAKVLRRYEGLLDPRTDDPEAMQTARSLHAAWKHWCEGAEALLARIPWPWVRGPRVSGVDDLRYGVIFARGIISMSPEEFLRRLQGVERGEGKTYHSIEEIRRELGLPPKSRRSA